MRGGLETWERVAVDTAGPSFVFNLRRPYPQVPTDCPIPFTINTQKLRKTHLFYYRRMVSFLLGDLGAGYTNRVLA